LEDWDLADMDQFPHLAIDQLMHHIFYKDSGVTTLEPRKWVKGVDKAGLLNMLWVPHYNHMPITMIVINRILWLVHDGFLWLEETILITNMMIPRIIRLLHVGENLAMEFGINTSEHDLAKEMKDKFKLTKKPRRYSITNITNPTV